jgi:hypothetical protein
MASDIPISTAEIIDKKSQIRASREAAALSSAGAGFET